MCFNMKCRQTCTQNMLFGKMERRRCLVRHLELLPCICTPQLLRQISLHIAIYSPNITLGKLKYNLKNRQVHRRRSNDKVDQMSQISTCSFEDYRRYCIHEAKILLFTFDHLNVISVSQSHFSILDSKERFAPNFLQGVTDIRPMTHGLNCESTTAFTFDFDPEHLIN